jgi:hypothetical protein
MTVKGWSLCVALAGLLALGAPFSQAATATRPDQPPSKPEQPKAKPAPPAPAKPPAHGEMGQAHGQGHAQTGQGPSAADMQAMMAAMQPGPHHKALQGFAGDWNVVVKTWMAPGTEPSITKGTSHNAMIYDGRYLKKELTGEMMGMPFQGMGLVGYDNVKKEYRSLWIDSMSTALMISTGSCSDDGKTWTYTGEMPGMDGSMQKVREVVKVVSDAQHVFSMYMSGPDGKEMQWAEITYNRQ